MPASLTALAELHLDLLYERDEAGLLLRSRDPAMAAPVVHLVRTVVGNRWLLAAALSGHERAELEAALAREPVLGDFADFECHPPVLAAIVLRRGRAALKEWRGPAFLFPDRLRAPTTAVEILDGSGNARLVPELAWVGQLGPAAQPVCVARNEEGKVVAVCHSARLTAAAAEAGVETASAYRGRGLAGAVVLGWAAAVRAQGRLPLYSTEWPNLASRAVARKLALIPYGEDYRAG